MLRKGIHLGEKTTAQLQIKWVDRIEKIDDLVNVYVKENYFSFSMSNGIFCEFL